MRKRHNWFWAGVLLIGIVVSGLPARADTIMGGPVGLTSPATVITFDEFGNLGNGTAVTNQWAAFGVTFSYSGPSATPNVSWDGGSIGQAGALGFSGGSLVFPALSDIAGGVVTISFSTPVTGAAFATLDFANVFLFQSLLGGTPVESFTMEINSLPGSGFVGFQNSYFDSIQITLNSQQSCCTNLLIDSLQIQPVPEPASLLLLGTGLAGIAGLSRRKRNAATVAGD